jgi:hypothetical protein
MKLTTRGATLVAALLVCVQGWCVADAPPLYLPLVMRDYAAPSAPLTSTVTTTLTRTPTPTLTLTPSRTSTPSATRTPLPTGTPSPTLSLTAVATASPTRTLSPTPIVAQPACGPWVQVNDGAFGLGDPQGQNPPYDGEDAFEVVVHNGQLYLGMEADQTMGARLWRTKRGISAPKGQADWELVVPDAFGDPRNDHIDSLASFEGWLYATTANWDYAAQIWRSQSGNPGTWEQVNRWRFGSYPNRNGNLRALDVISVDGTPWLCGGTSNEDVGAQVWCTADGQNWAQKNAHGFGSVAERPASLNFMVLSSGIHNGQLYMGVLPWQDAEIDMAPGSIWRTSGEPDPTSPGRWVWKEVFSGVDARPADPITRRGCVLGSFRGFVYGAMRDDDGIVIWRSETGNRGTWERVGAPGLGDRDNRQPPADGAVIYRGGLYLAATNWETGVQIYRTCDGETWETAAPDGFGDPDTPYAQLVVFDDALYSWAGNYARGQQVWRSTCAKCQR